MAIETLAVAETKNFRSLTANYTTSISVTIPGPETDSSFDIACPGVGGGVGIDRSTRRNHRGRHGRPFFQSRH